MRTERFKIAISGSYLLANMPGSWPAAHDIKSETLFEVLKHLIYGIVYYINIFTNLSLLSVEMYLWSKLVQLGHLVSASLFCLVQDATRKLWVY